MSITNHLRALLAWLSPQPEPTHYGDGPGEYDPFA